MNFILVGIHFFTIFCALVWVEDVFCPGIQAEDDIF